MSEFGFTRIFPKKFVPDRMKHQVQVENYDYDMFFNIAIFKIFEISFAIQLLRMIKEVQGSQSTIPHYKPKYPFPWSFIMT